MFKLPFSANRILASLPLSEAERVVTAGRVVELSEGAILHSPGEPIGRIYFPMDCVLSVQTLMEDGTAIEAATVGREGMSGLPVFFRSNLPTTRTVVLSPGRALALDSSQFRQQVKRSPHLCNVAGRYAELLFMQSAQSLACERVHTVDQRLARWLLTTADQAGSATIRTSQAAIARALGVRRASVTAAIRCLAADEIVEARRGRLTILRRAALRSRACECYAALDEFFE
jgi:CRP-like cAMP-binding protein